MALKDLFNFKRDPNRPKMELTLTNVILLVGLTLIIFQALGLIFGNALGTPIKLGPIFVLIPILISSFLGIVVLKRLLNNEPISRADAFSIVIITIIAIAVLFLLKSTVPEIFATGVGGLQSMLGLA
jgi:hypothetical protein